MPKDKLIEYDSNAANNTDCGSVNLAENSMLPSDVNNYAREIMSHLKEFADGSSGINVLALTDDTDTNQIKVQAPASVTATVTFTLPDGDGTDGQTLITDGSGTLSWGAGGGGSFLGDSGGGTADIVRVHEDQLDTDITVAANTNGLAAGPLTVATGVVVTVNGNLVIA
jgi:hypothetical protein